MAADMIADEKYERKTELKIGIPDGQLVFAIQGRLSARQRREWALLIAEKLKDLPGMQQDGRASIVHFEQTYLNQWVALNRRVSLHRALRLDSDVQKLGFNIRIRRLEL